MMASHTRGMMEMMTAAAKESDADRLKRYEKGLDAIAHTMFHWQATQLAKDLLRPPNAG